MIIGMDSSIALMAGDPAAGGSIDVISNETGIAWNAWTLDPNNMLYFMGVDGIYRLPRGSSTPESITANRLDDTFATIDLTQNRVILTWDFLRRGLQVMIANIATGEINTSLFYEARTDGWFPDAYPATYGPDTMLGYDTEAGNEKALLFGCRDGYIRKLDPDAIDDDGIAITSNIRFLPIGTRRGTDSRLQGLDIILAEGSGDVRLKVYTGQTAEQCAITTEVRWSRVLKAGRNNLTLPRLAGAWLQIEFTSTARWGLESVFGVYEETGRTRQTKRGTS
jgi:hypothetical protein